MKAGKTSRWFNFDDRKKCDWFVFIFKANNGSVRSWVIPNDVALRHANNFSPSRKDAWFRDISWSKLNKPPLSFYEDNWQMSESPEANKPVINEIEKSSNQQIERTASSRR